MTQQLTLSIIKPNAVRKGAFGLINSRLQQARIKIVACKMLQLDPQQAAGFYAEHQGKAFFDALIQFMTSGPIIIQVLQGENVINNYRDLMGATDPKQAKAGTLRYDFADNVTENAVHGSDSETSAAREIAYFFAASEIFAD